MTATFLGVPPNVASGAPKDGDILSQDACARRPVGTYQEYVRSFRASVSEEVSEAKAEGFEIRIPSNLDTVLPSQNEFETMKAYKGFECRRIKYVSDGLQVVAYVWKPKATSDKRLPVIIFNRGGRGEFGQIGSSPIWSPWDRFGFHKFVSSGFVVIASQYRGNDGGEGKEDFGGFDVHDVLNLIPLVRGLSYADSNNIFLMGVSRGGMMTYLALKEGIDVRAAATIGGVADLLTLVNERPEMRTGLMDVVPGLTLQNDLPLRERSAVYWAERIKVPVLIMAGGSDWRVNPLTNALSLATKLQALHARYELVVYEDDDHGLTLNRADSDEKIVSWFKQHMSK